MCVCVCVYVCIIASWMSPAALTALILPSFISNLNVSRVSATSFRCRTSF